MRSGSDIRARVATEDSLLPSQVFEQGIEFGIDSLFFNNEVLSLQKAHITLYHQTRWLARLQQRR